MSRLVGYKRFVSKKNGKEFCVANVVGEYGAREKANGCVGEKIEEIFLPEEKVSFLQPSHIGKEIKLEYELSGGRAYIVDFEILGK